MPQTRLIRYKPRHLDESYAASLYLNNPPQVPLQPSHLTFPKKKRKKQSENEHETETGTKRTRN